MAQEGMRWGRAGGCGRDAAGRHGAELSARVSLWAGCEVRQPLLRETPLAQRQRWDWEAARSAGSAVTRHVWKQLLICQVLCKV